MAGWISLHRDLLDNPIVCKDTQYFTLWVYLLLQATHKELPKIFKGNKIILKRGQLITGRKKLANKFNISESKVQRILKMFQTEQMIEQQTSNKNRLITILKYSDYQDTEQQNERQVNNKRTADEQQVNTNNNVNKENKVNKGNKRFVKPTQIELDKYCTEKELTIDTKYFFDYYEANGWKVGKNAMKDWKATLRNWNRRNTNDKSVISADSNDINKMSKEKREALNL